MKAKTSAKNQIRFEIFEKNFKFTYENLNWKIDFLLVFYPIIQDICHFIQQVLAPYDI